MIMVSAWKASRRRHTPEEQLRLMLIRTERIVRQLKQARRMDLICKSDLRIEDPSPGSANTI